MPTKNWQKAESDFSEAFELWGKQAFVHRLTDTRAARNFVAAQPSDYLVTVNGETFYAEVKSTQDVKAFHFSNIRKQQMAKSRMIAKAGGLYFFFIKSEHLGQWYCIPAQIVHNHPVKHLTWIELEPYKYDPS